MRPQRRYFFQNPDINAATFLNLLKSKGFVINAPKVVDPEPKQNRLIQRVRILRRYVNRSQPSSEAFVTSVSRPIPTTVLERPSSMWF